MNKSSHDILQSQFSDLFMAMDGRSDLPFIAARCLDKALPLGHLEQLFFSQSDDAATLTLWRALKKIISFLKTQKRPRQAQRELEILARVYFDVSTEVALFFPCAKRDRENLMRRYTKDFTTLFEPVLNPGEQARGHHRINEFLEGTYSHSSGTTPKR